MLEGIFFKDKCNVLLSRYRIYAGRMVSYFSYVQEYFVNKRGRGKTWPDYCVFSPPFL